MSVLLPSGSRTLHPSQPLTAEHWLQDFLAQRRRTVSTLPVFELRGRERTRALERFQLLRQYAGVLKSKSVLWSGLCKWASDEKIRTVAAIIAATDHQHALAQDSGSGYRAIITPDTMTSMAEYLTRVRKRHLAYQCWESSAERRALINSQQILLEALSISLTDFIRKVVRTTEHPEQYELPSFHTRTRTRDWDRHDGQAVLPHGDEAWAPLETFLQKLDRRAERREVARRFMRHRSASPRIEHVSPGPAPQILITAPPEEPHSDAPSQVSSASTILNQESASSCGSQLLQPPPVSRGHHSSHNPLTRVARPVSPSPRRSASPCPSPELLPSCPAKALGKRRAIDDGSPTLQRPRKRPRIARVESWSNSSDADVSAGESSNSEAPSPPPPAVPEDPPTPDSSTAVSSCGSERHPTSEASFPSRSSSLEVNVGDESARHAQYPCSTYTLATMSGPQDGDMDMDSIADDEDAASYTTADDCLSIDERQLLPSPPAPTPAPSPRAPARHSRFIGSRRCWDGVIQFVQEMLRF